MARPRPKKKRAKDEGGQLPLPTSRPLAPSSATRVLPMELQLGDRLADETGEWEIIARPYTTAGGKTAHVRVQRVGQPDVTDLRTWGAHERINVRRVTTEEGQPMMRLGRRASLLVAFSLLASAATASAECAWIWWAMTGDTADVAGGYTTKQECERALWTFEAQLKPFPQKVSRLLDGNRLMVTSSQSGKDLATIHSCLPDTVDPRGAKR